MEGKQCHFTTCTHEDGYRSAVRGGSRHRGQFGC